MHERTVRGPLFRPQVCVTLLACCGDAVRIAPGRRRRRMWDEWLAFGETIVWPAPPRLGTAPVWRGFARELTAPGSDLMDRVAGAFARVEGHEGADEYLDLLTETLQERVRLDRRIPGPRPVNAQRRALDGMAASLGLTADDVVRLNRHYMLRL